MRCVVESGEFRGVKVLVTGLSRSGSTWQYNAVKAILQRAADAARRDGRLGEGDYAVRSAHADGDSELFDACLDSHMCVLKTHIFVPRLVSRVDVILTSHRDVRDVVLSSMLMFRACLGPTGETRTQRSHSVTHRFQQYAHWTPYACYDMNYERMMANRTAEVERLARAALRGDATLAGAIDAQDVVDQVDELSSRRPERCAQSFRKTGRGSPTECWDSKSGFASRHVHESTSKPMAWARRAVLDEVQRRMPTCDVAVSLRRVVAGFGGWLQSRGYPLRAEDARVEADEPELFIEEDVGEVEIPPQDNSTDEEESPSWLKTARVVKLLARKPERRSSTEVVDDETEASRVAKHGRELLSVEFYPFDDQGQVSEEETIEKSSPMTTTTNSFVDSLPEAAYAMDPARRLPRSGFPVLYPRFVHVVNPFARKGPHPSTRIGGEPVDEDEAAHASLALAWKLAKWFGIDVEIASALRRGDRNLDHLATRWPTRRSCISENGIDTGNGMRLPLLRDLLACAAANDRDAHFVVLTNPDILVHHHFYLRLYQLVLDERKPFRTAWSITRRQIAPRNFHDLAEIFSTRGEPHVGHDTFVFPREWLPRLEAANLVPGFSPWGGAFLALLAHLGRAVVLGDKRWTFHLAADGKVGGSNRTAALREQLLTKRMEVCENAPGTLYNAREAAAALAATLGEATPSRCCCSLDDRSSPPATSRMPGPNAYYALDLLSGPKRPPVKPLGLESYEYLWDRLGPDPTLSRCAALPGIQLLPAGDLAGVVRHWCQKRKVACAGTAANAKRPRTPDCARAQTRSTFEAELADDVEFRGKPMTALVAYEKLPTPYEGGHVRVRQLVSWLCYQGHRVLLVHRDVQIRAQSLRNRRNDSKPGEAFLPEPVDVGIPGCSTDNLAVFAVDETMAAMTAHELARQRVDVAFVTVWFYRVDADPIPALALPVLAALSRLRQRKVKVALVSDDVQHERALAVGKSRGDDPDYWLKVKRFETEFYSDPSVDVVFAISDDDRLAFAKLQELKRSRDLRRAAERRPKRRGRRSTLDLRDETTTSDRPKIRAAPPTLAVLPYVARIDGATVKFGWDAHATSASRRQGIAFVGGGTYSNRVAVRWLLRAALPAVAALGDDDGGCADLRAAKLLLVGAAAWADEASKACLEARRQRKHSIVALLCDSELSSSKQFGKWAAPGVRALGRVADVGAVLRKTRLFVAPAVVASGISTKVWLALEHGLPIATSFDGTRGLPVDARRDAAYSRPPWTLVGPVPRRNATYSGKDVLTRESASRFARDAARVYCSNETWRRHAKASLLLAKRLESRRPWSGPQSQLAALFASPPELRCIDDLADKRADVEDRASQASLLDDIQAKFAGLHRQYGGCRHLAQAGL